MTAGFGFCRRPLVGAVAVGLLAYGVTAYGQEIRLQPVTASDYVIALPDPTDCDDSEIVLSQGGGTVTLFVELSGWDSVGGGHEGDVDWFLGGPQGTIDSGTYDGGIPGNPGTLVGYNLVPVGWPGDPDAGGFQAVKICGNQACLIGPPVDCAYDWFSRCEANEDCTSTEFPYCYDREDYVFNGMANSPTLTMTSLDYAYMAASATCKEDPRCDPSNCCRFYMGSLILNVPADAKGTYNVNYIDHEDFTMFNNCPGQPIPGLILKAASITVETGKCCYEIGDCQNPDPLTSICCTDGLTAAECLAKGAPRLPIDPDSVCADGCIECLVNNDCKTDHPDGSGGDDLCTTDTCDGNGVCQHVPNYVVGVECCDPDTGDTEVIDDGYVCTEDLCVHYPYSLTHPALTGDPCTVGDAVDDGFPEQADCYYDFKCLDTGLCSGTDINTVPCTGKPPVCPAGVFECEAGMCLCEVCSTLVFEVLPGMDPEDPKLDPNCFALGQEVNVTVAVTGGSKTLTGGQFLIEYDPDCLDFQSIGPCDGSVFSENPIKIVDEDAGTIFYVALIDPAVSEGAPVGEMACMTFLKLDGCDECDLCFMSVNPQNTILMDDHGYAVTICNPDDCSKPVRLLGYVDVDGPDGAGVNSDCGLPTALIEWDTPTAEDTCDGALEVICHGAYQHDVGEGSPDQGIIDDLIMNGGVFTQGVWFFECSAQNSCGTTDQYVWTVAVSDQNALDVEVHLGQPIVAGNFSRCICFELFADCYKDPTEICKVLNFGPPYNFKGHAVDSLKIDKDNYLCVNAIDPLHTLRSSADIECVENTWVAIWKGDPLLGGNWLVGGNLDYIKPEGGNGPNTIDVRDFGQFIIEVGVNYGTPDTTCDTPKPHADINGDGLVDNIDFGIIQMNFLKASKIACCPEAEAQPVPLTEISVKQLRLMGLGDLVVADLNGDGLLNVDDMAAYQEGVAPVDTVIQRKRGTR